MRTIAAIGVSIGISCVSLSGPATAGADSGKSAQGAANSDSNLPGPTGNLSKKLDQTNGVIHPNAAIDPGMAKPAPPVGATPVIPPDAATHAQPK
jgi:hypothetical protein